VVGSQGIRTAADEPGRHGSPVSPIVAISATGTIRKANLQARRLLGESEEIEGRALGMFLAQFMTQKAMPREQAVLRLPTGDEEPLDVLLVMSDREAAAEIREAPVGEEQTPGNIADFIAHELRNNIAISLGLSQLLESNFDSINPADRVSALKGIQTEAESALLVLDGLLKLVESRRLREVPASSVPLHGVLHRVVAEHKRRYPSRAFVISGDTPVFATGNSTWIRLAIANLISNAEKVTPRERGIEINIRQESDRAIILVMDQGRALSPVVYGALWDIYSKGAPEGVEISGSGIGLSLCKELVEAMGGRVWAGPRTRGGSAFAISLPSLAEARGFDMHPSSPSGRGPPA
jgi:signal transduction histidine kinase